MKSILRFTAALLAGLIIFLGLPLLGWGLGHVPAFFANPARLAYAIVISLLQVFSLLYNPAVGQNRDDRKDGLQRRRVDLILIQVFSLAVVIVAPFSDGHAVGVWNAANLARFLGFALLIPGFMFMQMAEKYLGRQFSVEVTLQKDHKLIQAGPYKFIRHPRYLGILAFFSGISLVFRSLLSFGVVAALGVVLIWRVQAEETLMRQEFGADWDAYCRRSWRLIPFLY
jgi:protein-S-isoprenylcysteine O-methyltransferase Ste14